MKEASARQANAARACVPRRVVILAGEERRIVIAPQARRSWLTRGEWGSAPCGQALMPGARGPGHERKRSRALFRCAVELGDVFPVHEMVDERLEVVGAAV